MIFRRIRTSLNTKRKHRPEPDPDQAADLNFPIEVMIPPREAARRMYYVVSAFLLISIALKVFLHMSLPSIEIMFIVFLAAGGIEFLDHCWHYRRWRRAFTPTHAWRTLQHEPWIAYVPDPEEEDDEDDAVACMMEERAVRGWPRRTHTGEPPCAGDLELFQALAKRAGGSRPGEQLPQDTRGRRFYH
jgi:hypothetical protein